MKSLKLFSKLVIVRKKEKNTMCVKLKLLCNYFNIVENIKAVELSQAHIHTQTAFWQQIAKISEKKYNFCDY